MVLPMTLQDVGLEAVVASQLPYVADFSPSSALELESLRLAEPTFQAAAVGLDEVATEVEIGPHDVPVAPIHAMASEVGLHEVVAAETDQAAADVPPEIVLAEAVGHDDHVTAYGGHDLAAATK